MPDGSQLMVFIAAGWLLNLSPGPDVLYIITNALRSGTRAGIAAALGIIAGCFVHVAAAAVGVSALLAPSATAFTVLKWIGAAYLMWIGVKLLYAKGPPPDLPLEALAATPSDHRRIFAQGFLTNVLNPKVALFFLAFVPQFIAPDYPDKIMAFLLLGLLFNINSLPINLGYAVAAGWASRRIDVVHRITPWMDRLSGVLLIGFGLKLALTDAPRA